MKRVYCLVTIILVLASCQVSQGKTNTVHGIIDDIPIISELHVDQLERGKKHQFYFQTIKNNLGQYWYLPVTVVRGARQGKKIIVTAAVHGTELNGIPIAGQLSQLLNPDLLRGTVTIVHQLNIPGLLTNFYDYKPSGAYRGLTYPTNGSFEVDNQLSDSAELFASAIWHKLLINNADYALDLHTAMTGYSSSYLVLANFNNLEAAMIANMLNPDIIAIDDQGEGTIERSFVNAGIPAVTLEIGNMEKHQANFTEKALAGILNYFTFLKIIPGKFKLLNSTYITNEAHLTLAEESSFFLPVVKMNQQVAKGDLLGTTYNQFGEFIRHYRAEVAGMVYSILEPSYVEEHYLLVELVYYDRSK